MEIELQSKEGSAVNEGTIRSALGDKELDANSIQSAGENRWLIRTKWQKGLIKMSSRLWRKNFPEPRSPGLNQSVRLWEKNF